MNPQPGLAAVKIVALAVLAACIGVGAALVVGNGHAAAPNVSARLGELAAVPLQRP